MPRKLSKKNLPTYDVITKPKYRFVKTAAYGLVSAMMGVGFFIASGESASAQEVDSSERIEVPVSDEVVDGESSIEAVEVDLTAESTETAEPEVTTELEPIIVEDEVESDEPVDDTVESNDEVAAEADEPVEDTEEEVDTATLDETVAEVENTVETEETTPTEAEEPVSDEVVEVEDTVELAEKVDTTEEPTTVEEETVIDDEADNSEVQPSTNGVELTLPEDENRISSDRYVVETAEITHVPEQDNVQAHKLLSVDLLFEEAPSAGEFVDIHAGYIIEMEDGTRLILDYTKLNSQSVTGPLYWEGVEIGRISNEITMMPDGFTSQYSYARDNRQDLFPDDPYGGDRTSYRTAQSGERAGFSPSSNPNLPASSSFYRITFNDRAQNYENIRVGLSAPLYENLPNFLVKTDDITLDGKRAGSFNATNDIFINGNPYDSNRVAYVNHKYEGLREDASTIKSDNMSVGSIGLSTGTNYIDRETGEKYFVSDNERYISSSSISSRVDLPNLSDIAEVQSELFIPDHEFLNIDPGMRGSNWLDFTGSVHPTETHTDLTGELVSYEDEYYSGFQELRRLPLDLTRSEENEDGGTRYIASAVDSNGQTFNVESRPYALWVTLNMSDYLAGASNHFEYQNRMEHLVETYNENPMMFTFTAVGEDGVVFTDTKPIKLRLMGPGTSYLSDGGVYSIPQGAIRVSADGTGYSEFNHEQKTISYETETRENPDLPDGTRNVIQAGSDGLENILYRIDYDINSVELSRTIDQRDVVSEPVDEIIEVGTGVVESREYEEVEEIPYETEYRANPNLEFGERETVQEGSNGTITRVYEQPTFNGEDVGEPTLTDEVTIDSTNEIIEIGTLEVETEPIEFETIRRENPDLYEDDGQVVQEGSLGERTITFDHDVDLETGELLNRREVSSEITIPAEDRIIEYGTRPVTTTETEPVPFTTAYRVNPELELGETRIVQEGSDGERTITFERGERVDSQITAEPTDEIVEVGTLETETEPEPFDTEFVENPDLYEGEERVVREGQDGERTITYIHDVDPETGELTNRTEVSDEITTPAENRIIEYGTRAVITTETEPVSYDTIYEETDELYEDEERVVQVGQDGERTITYERGEQVSSEITTDPVTEIIEVGTRPIMTTETEPVSYDTIYEETDELYEDEERVVQVGQDGERTITYERGEQVSSEITTDPVTEIIEVGTRPIMTTETEPVDFDTEYREDDTLYTDERIVEREGEYGERTITYERGEQVSSEITTEPVNQIIRVGTKPIMTTETEPVPYDTIYEETDELYEDEERVIQVGQDGERTITYERGEQVSDEITTDPVTEIIEVGTRPITTTETVPVNFDTEYHETDELFEGQREVVQEGQNGERTLTYERGELVSDEVTTDPVNRIIRVGTRVVREEYTVPVNYDTELRETDELPLGERRVVQEGQDGERTITLEYGQIVSDEVTTNPTTEIIEIGTHIEPEVIRETHIVPVDHAIEYRETDELRLGEREIVQEGSFGERLVTTENGEIVSDELTKEPVNTIIHIGTRIDREEHSIPVNYQTKIVETDELPLGERRVVQEGQNGERIIVSENGEIISDDIVQEPVTEIIEIGTGVIETDEPEVDEPETDEPEVDEPETDEPEVDEPETDEPEVDEPETDEPEVDEPEVDEPEVDEPEVDEPETDEPETDEPETDESETDESETDESETDEPETDESVEPQEKQSQEEQPQEEQAEREESTVQALPQTSTSIGLTGLLGLVTTVVGGLGIGLGKKKDKED